MDTITFINRKRTYEVLPLASANSFTIKLGALDELEETLKEAKNETEFQFTTNETSETKYEYMQYVDNGHIDLANRTVVVNYRQMTETEIKIKVLEDALAEMSAEVYKTEI